MRPQALRALTLMLGSALALAGPISLAAPARKGLPPQPAGPTHWASAAKTGIGTAYEAYAQGPDGHLRYADDGPSGTISKVWFSIAGGLLTETQWGLIHETQIRRLRVAVVTASGLAIEGRDTDAKTEFLRTDAAGRPLSPAYRVVTKDRTGRFEIEKHIFTDPDQQSLFLRITVRALKGPITPYLLLEPSMANTVGGDSGEVSPARLTAYEGKAYLSVLGAKPFQSVSLAYQGPSDGEHDLKDGRLDRRYMTTGKGRGALMLTAGLGQIAKGSRHFDLVIGFGPDAAASQRAAQATLTTGYDEVLAHFNGDGPRLGWQDYLAGLTELPRLVAQSGDKGRLLQASALMLKIQEDHSYAGALIASLSNPWGEDVAANRPSTGYKAVWPRDFYQGAMALAALGDRQTPLAAFGYLPRVQVTASTAGNKGATGWFQQKSHVDGVAEWVGVQLDQTAMPIMLGWKLWHLGWISDADIRAAYRAMLRPAADFLTDGGKVDLDWNKAKIIPPFTQQERWEEQAGYSPSTTAAVITGLTAAADMARLDGDVASAQRYQAAADRYSADVDSLMFTHKGRAGDGHYFLRLNSDGDPDNHSPVESRNAQPAVGEDLMLDAGFLELVRYGVRRADDPNVLATLPKLDDQTAPDLYRVHYELDGVAGRSSVPGWRRYGVDGYGERQSDGAGYGAGGSSAPDGRGRIWPLLTGERGHYELARLLLGGAPDAKALEAVRARYVHALEAFANEGLLLPEQVWDSVGQSRPPGYRLGQGTESATPLAWSHAEYVKLLRSFADQAVWDQYGPVSARYAKAEKRP